MQNLELRVSAKYLPKGSNTVRRNESNTLDMSTRQLILAFYSPGANDKSWVNKMVVMCSKNPYSHCELVFDNGLATSIMHGGTVFCKRRTFASENYVFKWFSVSHIVHEKIYNFACEQSRHNIPFSSSAMLTPMLGLRLRQTEGTFCSKYIMELLQHGGIKWAVGLNADLCTPSSIFDIIREEKNICFNSVPHRLNQLKLIY